MLSITVLPGELLVQIFCDCEDLKTAVRLSASCRRLRQTWCDNTTHVVRKICALSRENLHNAVDFAKLEEAAVARQACATTKSETNQQAYLTTNDATHSDFDSLARRYALSRLDGREDFLPSLRMSISISYRIVEWFDQAVRGVLFLPLYKFNAAVHRSADPDAMAHISALKHKIIGSRISLITEAPLSDACRLCPRGSCRIKWEMMWAELCVPILSSAFDRPILEGEMQEIETALLVHKDCCEHCFTANMSVVRAVRSKHEALVIEAVNEWRSSIRFHSVEAAIEGIRARSDRGTHYSRGIVIEDDIAFLTMCSGLGIIDA